MIDKANEHKYKYFYKGLKGLKEICENYGISVDTMRTRLAKCNGNIAEALTAGRFKYEYKGAIGVKAIAELTGLSEPTIYARLNKGMGIVEAVEAEVVRGHRKAIHEYKGVKGLKNIAEAFGVNQNTLKARIRSGMSIAEAVETPRFKRIFKK